MAPNSESDANHNDAKIINELPKQLKVEIVWRNVIGMLIIHLGGFYGLYLGVTGPGKFPVFSYILTMNVIIAISIIIGAHRLWSHRSYKAKWPLKTFLTVFFVMAMQNDIYEWSRDHRVHHKYSETDADPHNAKRGFFFAHLGWLLVKKHDDVKVKGKSVDMSDLWSDPIVRFQRRFYIPLVILLRGFFFVAIPMYVWNEPLVDTIAANLFAYCLTLHHTWLVNSAAHLYGEQPYDKTINPRDNPKIVHFTMGGGYHNYHHTFPWDYSASEFGWKDNFNPATAFIDVMAYIGQAYDLKKPSHETLMKRIERTGDRSLLIAKREKFNFWYDLIFGFMCMTLPLWGIFLFRLFLVKG